MPTMMIEVPRNIFKNLASRNLYPEVLYSIVAGLVHYKGMSQDYRHVSKCYETPS